MAANKEYYLGKRKMFIDRFHKKQTQTLDSILQTLQVFVDDRETIGAEIKEIEESIKKATEEEKNALKTEETPKEEKPKEIPKNNEKKDIKKKNSK